MTIQTEMEKRSAGLFSGFSHYLPGFGGMMMLLVMFMLGALMGNMLILGLQAAVSEEFAKDYGTVISYPVMFLPPMLHAWLHSRKARKAGLPGIDTDNDSTLIKDGARMIFIAGVSTFAAAFVTEPLALLLPPMPQWLEETMKQMMDAPLWITLLSVSVAAPFFEEWLCRGMIMRGLMTRMNPAGAILTSAAFFAVIHMNPWQALPAFCLGTLFGYVYYRTGSLKLCMIMHCVNNTLAVILGRIPALEEARTFMDVMSPWAYAGIYAACIVILACAVIILRSVPAPLTSGQTQD